MINTKFNTMPAYTLRKFRNFKEYEANSVYKYNFSREDNLLIDSGAIKLFPKDMLKVIVSTPSMIFDKKYERGEEVDNNIFDDKTFKVLVKQNVLLCEFKDDFKELSSEKLIELAKMYELVGVSFGKASELLNIDFDKIKEVFKLKQGGKSKKITAEDMPALIKFSLGE